MSTAAESDDSPLKSIFYLVAGVFVFSIQDVIIKWLSAKYPVNEIVVIKQSRFVRMVLSLILRPQHKFPIF